MRVEGGLLAMGWSERRLAAWVSLSPLTTCVPVSRTRWRQTAEPMKPAPPVMTIFTPSSAAPLARCAPSDWLVPACQVGALARGADPAIVNAHPGKRPASDPPPARQHGPRPDLEHPLR